MKSYKINSDKAGKIGKALASQLTEGKAGAVLITAGFSQDSFTLFLADLAHRAVNAGKTVEETASLFRMIAAGNASQAKQALADVEITVDDGKPQSLGAFWSKSERGPIVDLSSLGAL